MNKKVTLRDVAQLAGVSVATASYVLNRSEKQHISKETRARVRDAARQLNYMPNMSAKSLKSNRSACIGVAIDKDVTIPRYAQALQGIRQVLQESGYQLMLCSTQVLRGEYPDYITSYFARTIDGVIYIGADNKGIPSRMRELILRQSIPLVAFDCGGDSDIVSVDLDYFAGAREMVLFMMEKGLRRIHYLRPGFDNRQERLREQGVLRAVFEHPEVDLILHRLEFYHGGANMQIFQNNFSQEEKERFYEYAASIWKCVSGFREDLRDRNDVGIICSWGAMEQHVLAALGDIFPKPPVAVLAQGVLYPGSYPNLYYSELPNFEAGCTCAREILALLENPEHSAHIMLKPGCHRQTLQCV